MSKVEDILTKMRTSPQSISFSDLSKVCEYYFGVGRQSGTSHRLFHTPWQGNPRINIQIGDDGKAKPYQVRQVLLAIAKLNEVDDD
jgi:hypothetical protein